MCSSSWTWRRASTTNTKKPFSGLKTNTIKYKPTPRFQCRKSLAEKASFRKFPEKLEKYIYIIKGPNQKSIMISHARPIPVSIIEKSPTLLKRISLGKNVEFFGIFEKEKITHRRVCARIYFNGFIIWFILFKCICNSGANSLDLVTYYWLSLVFGSWNKGTYIFKKNII